MSPEAPAWHHTGRDDLEVLATGALSTVQDLGRHGHGAEGVPPSGAADAAALRLANRLVGNPEGEAGLEVTLGGLAVRACTSTTRYVALTGAPAPLRVGGVPAALFAPVALRPGEVVELGWPEEGARSYLAVSGGLRTPRELGSASTDLLGGLGPPPLRCGQHLRLGPAGAAPGPVDVAPPPPPPSALAVIPGPRHERLGPSGWAQLLTTSWTVATESNRIAVRLDGPPLELVDRSELPPEGLVTGAVQLPPAGRPIVFLQDHPVTGGYPVLAVVDDACLSALAQLRPGDEVRFGTTRGPGLRFVTT